MDVCGYAANVTPAALSAGGQAPDACGGGWGLHTTSPWGIQWHTVDLKRVRPCAATGVPIATLVAMGDGRALLATLS